MSAPTLYVTRGLPASGKTTWARRWVAEDPKSRARVNRDDLRAMAFGSAADYWSEENAPNRHTQEQAITVMQRAAVKEHLRSGRDVVADDMNLRPRYVREWAKFARGNGAELEVVEFPIHFEEAIKRDAARGRTVGEAVIRNMVAKYLRNGQLLELPDDLFDGPADPEYALYVAKPGTPRAVLVDIDGTVALNESGRGWYDYHLVGQDSVNERVVEAIRQERRGGNRVVFLSGRSEDCRDVTMKWLWVNGIANHDDPLFMRASGDKRKDAIVKSELFDAHVRDEYDVRRVYDDRNQVVQMWRARGLTVLQVADGAF